MCALEPSGGRGLIFGLVVKVAVCGVGKIILLLLTEREPFQSQIVNVEDEHLIFTILRRKYRSPV